MPGIAGLASERPAEECQRELAAMLGAMRHRTDYVQGAHCEPALGVYGGWLAHPGSMAQLVSSSGPDGLSTCFAGECFLASSDGPAMPRSSGILEAWRREKAGALTNWTGSFSALFLDRNDQRAWLCNDRFGLERLYIHETHDTFYFASEAKALLAVVPATRRFATRGVADFLAFGSVLEGRTLFEGIESLPGATLIEFEPRWRRTLRRYFLPAVWEVEEPVDSDRFDVLLADTFTSSINPYLHASERIGLSVTGGLDTRMLMACGIHPAANAVCYTFDAFQGETLDSRIGAKVAALRELPHHVLRLTPSFLQNFPQHVDDTVRVTDGCAGLLAAHEIPFNRDARKLAPIRVTGNYGSEVLRSMSTLKPLALERTLLEPAMRTAIDAAHDAASLVAAHPVTRAAFMEIPWHLHGTLCAARSQLLVRTPFMDNEIVRLAYLAPVTSRRSAEPAIRLVSRCDHAMARLPTDRGLALERKGVRSTLRKLHRSTTFKLDWLHREGLPAHWLGGEPLLGAMDRLGLLGLHKYLPYRRWLRTELRDYVVEMTLAASTRGLPGLEARSIATLGIDHVRGRHNRLREINAVLTLEAIERTLLRTGTKSASTLGMLQ